MPTLNYSPRRHRYVKPDGKVATERDVRSQLDTLTATNKAKFRSLSRPYLEGANLDQWQQEMKTAIRDQHYQMAAIAAGGEDKLTPEIRWIVDGLITEEYGHLAKLREDTGNLPNVATEHRLKFLHRASNYATAIKLSFSRVELMVKIAEGGWEGWRQLSGSYTVCKNCPDHATGGFVPVEEIVAIGSNCVCRANCQCRIRFRRR